MSRRNRPPKAVREAALKAAQREAAQDHLRERMEHQARLDRLHQRAAKRDEAYGSKNEDQ